MRSIFAFLAKKKDLGGVRTGVVIIIIMITRGKKSERELVGMGESQVLCPGQEQCHSYAPFFPI